MKAGDLVKDRYFKQYGIITSKSFRRNSLEYVWVLFQNGSHTKYKVNYLEVIDEKRN